ncbi:uncharacterized protein A1O9_03744 [Exophiala aquamarina CBS 119918]|uniref:Ferric oxidoreductase domain-containing protein n=1 Tax=Exophiala aquamarina CBS 119918 TaxID=1182545 RepID=A0A072PGB8_9EURO|nr:uncharacterized protein A1O9_03744 [Exophiala aquamarina CBS 119918]KEF58901.1 hypothetical protein A1O9_03744 [Exophiala aquamarina CBS 119918]
MKLFFLGLLVFVSSTVATGPVPVSRSGLAGVDGFTFYDPYCAHGCFRCFSSFKLSCTTIVSPGGHTTGTEAAHNLAVCRSSNFPYLSSIAWCIQLYCPSNVRASTVEKFWETQITGDVKILPKWTYGETLANITTPVTEVAEGKELILSTTMLTTHDSWKTTQDTLIYFFRETAQESYYGLSICLTAFALPIILTWLGCLPFMTTVLEQIKPWIYPSILRTYHDRPLPYLIGNVPTVGQGLYIAVVALLNIIFLVVGYKCLYPNHVMQWYVNHYQELMAYWMWRTGVLAFANMPTLLHSILALVLYQNTGSYDDSLKTKWWIWGCVATVAAVIIMLTSVVVLRQRAYELFLMTHIVMAVICVVGCWYHIWYGYEGTFGYETWLYATIAVWFFDRLARLGRILKTGIKRAKVSDVGPTIARVDIPGIRWAAPGQCVYVYFPTLNILRPWDNHPFSMIPTSTLVRPRHSDRAELDPANVEKNHTVTVGSQPATDNHTYTTSGLTLFIRKRAGMTGSLKLKTGLLTLLEGPYPTIPTRAVLQSDRLVLIGGGIGITGLLPFLQHHSNAKLFYSVKAADQSLVDCLRPVLDNIHEKEIVVGSRLDIDGLLRNEAGLGWAKIAVVVCGPAGMCDDVRAVVSMLAREKSGSCSFELEVDAFSW